jgi:hypothetical protein
MASARKPKMSVNPTPGAYGKDGAVFRSPATSIYEGSARLGLVKIIRERGESEFSNYRKFTVDTESSFVPPPVKK